MKYLIHFLIVSLFSFSIFAKDMNFRPEVCYTDGECATRNPPTIQSVCFKICQLNGQPTCTDLPVTSICDKGGKVYGVCKPEVVAFSSNDPKNSDECIDASEAP
jgi:hypothetical protein